ncbi:MAG: DUF1525 domain-containing protein [Boseongicola sp. SB0673_bin_14]|nr:DUF1525 domain-containing protein [Boseongicola sp. SB0673_bin_14]
MSSTVIGSPHPLQHRHRTVPHYCSGTLFPEWACQAGDGIRIRKARIAVARPTMAMVKRMIRQPRAEVSRAMSARRRSIAASVLPARLAMSVLYSACFVFMRSFRAAICRASSLLVESGSNGVWQTDQETQDSGSQGNGTEHGQDDSGFPSGRFRLPLGCVGVPGCIPLRHLLGQAGNVGLVLRLLGVHAFLQGGQLPGQFGNGGVSHVRILPWATGKRSTFGMRTLAVRIGAFPGVLAVTVMLTMLSPGVVLANQGIPDHIVVYTVSTIPVTVPRELVTITTVMHLDRALVIEAQLAEGLDRLSEGQRDAAASSRLTKSLAAELETIWEGLLRIRNENITHLPAIVLDDRAVWYGADLRRAVARYRNRWNAGGGL